MNSWLKIIISQFNPFDYFRDSDCIGDILIFGIPFCLIEIISFPVAFFVSVIHDFLVFPFFRKEDA